MFTDGTVVGDMQWATTQTWDPAPGAFSNWAQGEPNEGTNTGEDCGYIKGEGSSTQCQLGPGTGCWNDCEYSGLVCALDLTCRRCCCHAALRRARLLALRAQRCCY